MAAFGTPQQVALRSRIVLASAAGQSDCAIARDLDVNRNTVVLWRTLPTSDQTTKRIFITATYGLPEVRRLAADCQSNRSNEVDGGRRGAAASSSGPPRPTGSCLRRSLRGGQVL